MPPWPRRRSSTYRPPRARWRFGRRVSHVTGPDYPGAPSPGSADGVLEQRCRDRAHTNSGLGSAQLLVDLAPALEHEPDLLRHGAGQTQVGREILDTARAGVQPQQVETDRLERLHRIPQTPLHAVALGLQIRHNPVVP